MIPRQAAPEHRKVLRPVDTARIIRARAHQAGQCLTKLIPEPLHPRPPRLIRITIGQGAHEPRLASGAGIDHSVTRRVNCPEDLDGEVESMTCGHTMHSECFHTYKEVKGIPLVADLPCPLCKQTENDMARKESQLLDGTMLDDPGSPLPWQDLSLDAQPHMPETALVAADANGKQPLPVGTVVQQTAASGSAAPGVAAAGSAAADAQVPQHVVGLARPDWAEPSVFCSTCGNMAVLSRTSILAKREGTWRCNKCRVKITALFRGFGTWPVHEFESISEEEQRKFFADVQDKSGDRMCCHGQIIDVQIRGAPQVLRGARAVFTLVRLGEERIPGGQNRQRQC